MNYSPMGKPVTSQKMNRRVMFQASRRAAAVLVCILALACTARSSVGSTTDASAGHLNTLTGGTSAAGIIGGTSATLSTGGTSASLTGAGGSLSSDAGVSCPPARHAGASFEVVDCCSGQPCRGVCADGGGCACGITIGGCGLNEICCGQGALCLAATAANTCSGPPP